MKPAKMTHTTLKSLAAAMLLPIIGIASTSCERDEVLIDIVQSQVTEPVYTDVYGFYLLNEGNMGSNKSSRRRSY